MSNTINAAGTWVPRLREQVARVVVGQQYLVDRLLIGLLANGHVLLEGVPGLAKTLSVRTLAQTVHADFSRIQFTPDLLPADIVGTLIYDPKTGAYNAKRGPIFANFVLADEINRAPAKVQSALLEAMQERQVTLGGETHKLPAPFLVLATQNPIDQEGTYPLPEAQVDRFMLKLNIGYPTREEERKILDAMATTSPKLDVEAVITQQEILEARKAVDAVHVAEPIRDYIVSLVLATRGQHPGGPDLAKFLQFGASPRATINLTLAAKAWAFLQGRDHVTPQDVKDIAPDVLRHRLILTYEADAEGVDADAIVRRVLDAVSIPYATPASVAPSVPTNPQETLRRAQRVAIVAARTVNDAMVGAYLSRFKGRGTDFEELREYVPGDDVRTMDWNVTARTGKPFVRLHREERELTLVLAVDISGSSSFGSGEATLRERAADAAACLAISALKAGDKVGLLLFTDREELWVSPKKGRRHVLRIIRDVLEFKPASRRTSFALPMRRLGRALRRRSMVFVLSDFLPGPEGGDAMAAALGELNARHDTACVQLVDARERALPDVGVIALEDAETGEIREVDTGSERVRRAFAAQAEARLAETAAGLARAGMDVARLDADAAVAPTLARFFERRRRRR